jgi:hypothetical protein
LFFALLNSTICFSGQSTFIPGTSLGTLKLGISEREARKILGYPAKTSIKKNRIIWQYQNLPQIDSSVTTLYFEKRSLTQIETSNSKVIFQGRPLSECSVQDFVALYPNSKRVFIQLPDFSDPSVYLFDSNNGIGISFGIGVGQNFGKGSTEELAIGTVYVFPMGYAPIFPEEPIKEDQTVVIPGESIGAIRIGISESDLSKIGDMAFEDEQDGFVTMHVGGKLVYLADGKVAQISTNDYSCSVKNRTFLLSSLHEFLISFPNAKIEIRSFGRLNPTAFIYDRSEGIGVSFAVKPDQIVKGFFSKEIVPAYLNGSCLFVFRKGSEPPFLRGAREIPLESFASIRDFQLPLPSPPLREEDSPPKYFFDETSSAPTGAFLSLPLFSTTFVGWEVKEAPLNVSVSDFLTGLFPDEKISWIKSADGSFSFSVQTADRLIEEKNLLFLAFEIKQNPQRALLFKLLVNDREVQGNDFIKAITAMTHFALRKRGARPAQVDWN